MPGAGLLGSQDEYDGLVARSCAVIDDYLWCERVSGKHPLLAGPRHKK